MTKIDLKALKERLAQLRNEVKDLEEFLKAAEKYANIADHKEDTSCEAKRISQDELEAFVVNLLDKGPKDIIGIMNALESEGFDIGGANKRKNLATRLWRIYSQKNSFIKRDDGIYMKRKDNIEYNKSIQSKKQELAERIRKHSALSSNQSSISEYFSVKPK